ncbi:MAG: metallophosphatase family protein [Lachnospiraceae bacterium]|nr:metallophosphatase family protein [Lachnospiraceae bacterium]
MKIAVFSDVHGNLNALKSVLKQIEEKKVDQTIFLGDIFQRGNEEMECFNRKLFFSHFLFSDINRPYPFLQLADLKNGIFDRACKNEVVTKYDLVAIGHSHSNFVKYNVVSVSATGLEGASYLLISVDEEGIKFEHINID